jgi:hypothetical protein
MKVLLVESPIVSEEARQNTFEGGRCGHKILWQKNLNAKTVRFGQVQQICNVRQSVSDEISSIGARQTHSGFSFVFPLGRPQL